jgi:hypothetical protein
MRSPESYNAAAPPAKRIPMAGTSVQAATLTKVKSLTEDYCLNGFFRHLSRDGALPGLTLVYSGLGYTWQFLVLGKYSGKVADYRGSFLWFGDEFYEQNWTDVRWWSFAYDCASNAGHELGHSMFQPHGVAGGTFGANSNRHDPEADCFCVMSYGNSNGQFCGLSLLSFRGWDVPQPPA